jgi:hypothetical protein
MQTLTDSHGIKLFVAASGYCDRPLLWNRHNTNVVGRARLQLIQFQPEVV